MKEALRYRVGASQAVGEQGQKTERRGKVGETLPSSDNFLQTRKAPMGSKDEQQAPPALEGWTSAGETDKQTIN